MNNSRRLLRQLSRQCGKTIRFRAGDPDLSNGIDEDEPADGGIYRESQKDEFLYYFSRKYHGYVASDTGYTILHNDEQLLSIQLYTTVNIGIENIQPLLHAGQDLGKVLKAGGSLYRGSDLCPVLSARISCGRWKNR